jgi:DNA replication protein DnaC
MPAKHTKQDGIIGAMRSKPDRSYFLAGIPGTGKSLMMWSLYRYAVETGTTKVVACTLSELLDEYRAFIRASKADQGPIYPRLNADELRQADTRYSIFLDDIDKANPTDYVAEQVFNIVNAVYEYGHQLVVTTNKPIRALIDHYDRSDSRGEPIVRRMTENATIVEMF